MSKLKKLTEENDLETWLNSNHFYVIHGTANFDSLISILKEGKLDKGTNVDNPEFTILGKHGAIYGNIYFDDIKNIDGVGMFSYILLFHPRIMFRSKCEFYAGWGYVGYKPIVINPDDNLKIIKKKMKKIKNFVTDVKNDPTLLPLPYQGAPGNFLHEIFLETDYIPLTNNLLGIICNGCDSDKINKIKEIIATQLYRNMYIQTISSPLPDFCKINK
ncbi:MAG: hypothetical protein Terrestrivirus3_153 [Terrestrivirus sp.]|uniref:Uncharacterized protein n=1 Tax=Terrestrivirus sp. TaxID=2487775 RepID=A0A3G4ZN89_9VIRU|nr:MAG: hypothetical protein Terrestrivirus3_153 [Terrestrivirus sp.]